MSERQTNDVADASSRSRTTTVIDAALYVTVGLVVIAFGILLIDLVRQRSWLDVVLLLVGSALVTACFLLQRWTRPPTG